MNPTSLTGLRWTFGALAALMALTRFHHEGTPLSLPDASLAVFFLAGFYLKTPRHFLALLALAFAVDFLAIAAFGVDASCVSPAYGFLVPTYGAMWLAGAGFAGVRQAWTAGYVARFAASLCGSASVAFLISSASFFWFSGKVSPADVPGYFRGMDVQFVAYVGAAAGYAVLGFGLAALLRAIAIAQPDGADIR